MGSGTAIGRVRGLGAAHAGTHHWWRQRLTAGGNIFVMSWLLLSLARLGGYDYASVHAWLASPWVAVPMALIVANTFYHFRLGLQVVIGHPAIDSAKAETILLRYAEMATGARLSELDPPVPAAE